MLPGPQRTLLPHTTRPPVPFQGARQPYNRMAYASAHVVADPLSDRENAIDWDATIDYRLYLWSLGLGVAEAMDTAQRGAGLDWMTSIELLRRCVASSPPGAAIVCGANTDHLPATLQHGAGNMAQIAGAYLAQCEAIERVGGRIVLMPSRALAASARSVDDYNLVYGKVLSQVREPVILQWLGEIFDPALASYWGDGSIDGAAGNLLEIVTTHAAKIDGIALQLLDPDLELEFRRRLPRGVRMYTGDELNYPTLMAGDDDGYSHAMLGVLNPIAPAAAAALGCLQRDELDDYLAILEPTQALAQHMFRSPTQAYTAGIVFMAYLNGHQPHFMMIGGQQSARSILHLAELFRLADEAGLLRDPDDACARMSRVLALAGLG